MIFSSYISSGEILTSSDIIVSIWHVRLSDVDVITWWRLTRIEIRVWMNNYILRKNIGGNYLSMP